MTHPITRLVGNSDNQLFGEHLDAPEPLELSSQPDLGYPPPDPLFKTTVRCICNLVDGGFQEKTGLLSFDTQLTLSYDYFLTL